MLCCESVRRRRRTIEACAPLHCRSRDGHSDLQPYPCPHRKPSFWLTRTVSLLFDLTVLADLHFQAHDYAHDGSAVAKSFHGSAGAKFFHVQIEKRRSAPDVATVDVGVIHHNGNNAGCTHAHDVRVFDVGAKHCHERNDNIVYASDACEKHGYGLLHETVSHPIRWHQHCFKRKKGYFPDESSLQLLCKDGQIDKALAILDDNGSPPSTSTYLSLLRACIERRSLSHAKQVHAHLVQHHVELSGILGDYLIVMLAKCGAIDQAWQVSSTLPSLTVFSWTAMISAYAFCGHAEEALKMHRAMLDDGVEPSSYTFVILLKACGIIQNLEQGKELHAAVRRKHLTSDVFIGSTLISMYGKCGEVEEAEIVFNALSHRNAVTWNAMLGAYVEQDQGKEALQCYRQMQEEGVSSDQHTFLFALQACTFLIEEEKFLSTERRPTKWMSLEVVRSLHADAQRKGFSSDVFVGSTFVSMYGKCAAIAEAEYTFGLLSQRNVVSWTAMLSAYIEDDAAERALQLYRQMQVEGLSPDRLASVSALQACCTLAEDKGLVAKGRFNKVIALEIGQAVAADTSKDSIKDVVFGTALLTMYGKCGAIMEAELTFAAMSQQSIVSWNAMLSLFVELGQMEKALQLYRQMLMEGMNPDQRTIVFALQAVCFLADGEEAVTAKGESRKVMSLEIVFGLHFDAQRKAVLSDVFVGNTLVSMYGKCGAISQAEQMFLAMGHHNVVSWTAMLSAYFEQGQGLKVLQLYVLMLQAGITPDHLAIVMALKACGTLAEKEEVFAMNGQTIKTIVMEIGQALHNDIRQMYLESNALVGTALVSMYGKCGATLEAEHVFMALVEPDVISWSAMLSAYVDQKHGEKALMLYRQMQQEGLPLDYLTSVIVLQACSILAEKGKPLQVMGKSTKAVPLEIGRALHADAHKKGFAYDLAFGNTIMNVYGKCGAVVEAEQVFWAMSHRNIVSWNAMVSVCAEQGEEEKALLLYREMQKQPVTNDDLTLIFVLKACCAIGCLEICSLLHFDIVCAGYESIPPLAASLICAYGSCASMRDACLFLTELSEPCLASWNACITCCAGEGNGLASLQMFEALRLTSVKPDGVTFTTAISACSHTGFVIEGLHYFVSMSQDYNLSPDVKHYGSVLDSLARVGDFKRVKDLVARMPVQPDETVWLCLLGACQTHGNIDLAEHAFSYASNIQPMHAAAYVVMSNVYANAGASR